MLTELVLDHAGVVPSVAVLHADDLEGAVRELPDPLVLRDRPTVGLPVKLRGGVANCNESMIISDTVHGNFIFGVLH